MGRETAMDVERTIEFLLEQGAALDAKLQKLTEDVAATNKSVAATNASVAQTNASVAQTNAVLRRAIRYSVEEHRRERVRRKELEAKLEGEIAEFRKAIQDWYRRNGGNGHQPS